MLAIITIMLALQGAATVVGQSTAGLNSLTRTAPAE
jgi:hypothetical protein